MAFYRRTFNPTGSWIGTEHQLLSQRNLLWLSTAEENRNMAPLWTTPNTNQYQHVRSTRFSASKYWRESGDWRAAQKGYSGMVKLPTTTPREKMETLTFVGNFNHPQLTSVRSSQVAPIKPAAVAPVRKETFVENFSHASNVTQDQFIALLNSRQSTISGSAVIRGVSSTQKTPLNPTWSHSSDSGNMNYAHPSTSVDAHMPTQEQRLQWATALHPQETSDLTHVGIRSSHTRSSAESVKSLNNVMNLMAKSDDTTASLKEAGHLRFVGNFTLPAEVLHGQQSAQVPCSVSQEGVNSPRVSQTPSTSVAPASLLTGARGQILSFPKTSTDYYNRVNYVKMMAYHRDMASYYRELKLKAEPIPAMEGSLCTTELQGKTGSFHDWNEPPQKTWWDDATEGIVLPDDAVEKLDAIPGIWDLAIQMGFLTVCEADD
ncbi:hypothetical protein AALO_G00198040 [Alosa alosa]|uniref:Uncharacterized protein n=2 Tax=Alosa alosa TaxID=278164 RepID=A0AAV6G684_9TELE|nr:hypothetical protein AALO_G00198040 [Alosa alosa]